MQRRTELFCVLEGELVFRLDEVRHTVGPGGTVYSPRGVVHAYQNFTTSDARLLIATMPGAFGVMFEEMSAAWRRLDAVGVRDTSVASQRVAARRCTP